MCVRDWIQGLSHAQYDVLCYKAALCPVCGIDLSPILESIILRRATFFLVAIFGLVHRAVARPQNVLWKLLMHPSPAVTMIVIATFF